MRRLYPVVASQEITDFADELGLFFQELARTLGSESLAGEYTPSLDVYETKKNLGIAVDLPGVGPDDLCVVIKGSTVLIAGHKPPRRGRADSTFHLVERGFGRFARTVRLSHAFDGAHAHAMLRDGELRLVIPKMTDRRGQPIRVTVRSGTDAA